MLSSKIWNFDQIKIKNVRKSFLSQPSSIQFANFFRNMVSLKCRIGHSVRVIDSQSTGLSAGVGVGKEHSDEWQSHSNSEP